MWPIWLYKIAGNDMSSCMTSDNIYFVTSIIYIYIYIYNYLLNFSIRSTTKWTTTRTVDINIISIIFIYLLLLVAPSTANVLMWSHQCIFCQLSFVPLLMPGNFTHVLENPSSPPHPIFRVIFFGYDNDFTWESHNYIKLVVRKMSLIHTHSMHDTPIHE